MVGGGLHAILDHKNKRIILSIKRRKKSSIHWGKAYVVEWGRTKTNKKKTSPKGAMRLVVVL